MTKTIFITVGTTLFDPLVDCACNPFFLQEIALHGFGRLVVQYGKGQVPCLDGGDVNRVTATRSTGTSSGDGITTGVYHIDIDKLNDSSNCSSINNDACKLIEWEVYRFKSSLEADMKKADLIISHAGAGSIMEGLEHCRQRNAHLDANEVKNTYVNMSAFNWKKIVVVINDQLMNNHQCELAYALEKRNYLHVLSKPEMLLKAENIQKIIQEYIPKPFQGGNDSSFGLLLNEFMGYTKTN
jgi:beta-1,4-N-acetylglucosaminyltransferase